MLCLYTLLALTAFLPFLVQAHDNGMDMSMDGAMDLASGLMLPYLHFTTGDVIWFLGWVPKSAGAMVGACIGLFIMALVDRWLAAMRAVAEMHWTARAQIEYANRLNARSERKSETERASTPQKASLLAKSSVARIITMRTALPFIPSHDITRGIMHAGQTAIGFAFMLVVMTFQAGFILSIVVGLGVGEMLFGRHISAAAAYH